jgi:hypothetical protein
MQNNKIILWNLRDAWLCEQIYIYFSSNQKNSNILALALNSKSTKEV